MPFCDAKHGPDGCPCDTVCTSEPTVYCTWEYLYITMMVYTVTPAILKNCCNNTVLQMLYDSTMLLMRFIDCSLFHSSPPLHGSLHYTGTRVLLGQSSVAQMCLAPGSRSPNDMCATSMHDRIVQLNRLGRNPPCTVHCVLVHYHVQLHARFHYI